MRFTYIYFTLKHCSLLLLFDCTRMTMIGVFHTEHVSKRKNASRERVVRERDGEESEIHIYIFHIQTLFVVVRFHSYENDRSCVFHTERET